MKIKLTESALRSMIKQVINESFNHYKSPRLVHILKQHGFPIDNDDPLFHYILTQLTDDEVNPHVFTEDELYYSPDSYDKYDRNYLTRCVELKDGTFLDLHNSINNEVANQWFHSGPKPTKRIDCLDIMRPNNEFAKRRANDKENNPVDLYARKEYKPLTTRGYDARFLRTDPFVTNFKNRTYDNDCGWSRNKVNAAINNLKKGTDMNGEPNKKIY